MSIETLITKIIYQNSHDTSTGLEIDYERIQTVIDLIVDTVKPQPKAYLVMMGQCHETTSVDSIFTTLEDARACCKEYRLKDYDEDDESTWWENHHEDVWTRNDEEYMDIDEKEFTK